MCYMSTKPDMWHGKPEREDRTTSYQTLETRRRKPKPSVWPKIGLIVVAMFGLLWAVKYVLGW